jgi:hypothetical protein
MSRAASKDNLYLFDGWQNLSGGMDSSKTPDLIDDAYSALLANITVRGGKPKTRAGFSKLSLTSADGADDILRENIFLGGFAAADANKKSSVLLGNYGGYIIRIDTDSLEASVLNPSLLLHPISRTYFCQIEQYVIIQNGVDIPLIYNTQSGVIRRSRTDTNNAKLGIASITRSGTFATLTTTAPHNFVAGDYIEVQGASPQTYTGNFYIESVTSDTVVYDLGISSPISPATVASISYIRYAPEVPRGLFMAYGQGRLYVVSSERAEFLAGDIITGDVKGTVENALRFTETQYLAEGGSFKLPSSMGLITGMCIMPIQDTSTGQGDLFVFGEYGVASFNVSQPRSAVVDPNTFEIISPGWKDVGIQKVVLSKIGCNSHDSITSFNGDIMWRGADGIRSYRNARAESNSYGVTPMSAEMNRILKAEDPSKIGFISGTTFDNRFISTCAPVFEKRRLSISNTTLAENILNIVVNVRHGLENGDLVSLYLNNGVNILEIPATITGPYTLSISTDNSLTNGMSGTLVVESKGANVIHKALAILDFNSVSGVGGKSNPAWDGIWTGLNFHHVVSGFFGKQEKAYVFTFDGDSNNGVWEITRDQTFDFDGDSRISISSTLETKSFEFNSQFSLKQLQNLSLWVSDIQGEVTINVDYRPDNYPCWVNWGTATRCAEISSKPLSELDPLVATFIQPLPQSRARIDFPTPKDDIDPSASALLKNFFTVQVRISWTGNLTLDKLLLFSIDKPERVNAFI